MYNLATISATIPVEMLQDLAKLSIDSRTPINDLIYHAIKGLINSQKENNLDDAKALEQIKFNLRNVRGSGQFDKFGI